MDTLIFSQTAIFRMQQLASCVFQKTGVRHRMATQEGMLSLINEAGTSEDGDIRVYYEAFMQELNKRQLEVLAERSVKLRQAMAGSAAVGVRKAG